MQKYRAEFIGTFTLVLFGCGTAVVASQHVGILGIVFALGFALIATAYSIESILGCHISPAVRLGAYVARRMPAKDLGGYIIGQVLGGLAGASVIAKGILGGYELAEGGRGPCSPGHGHRLRVCPPPG